MSLVSVTRWWVCVVALTASALAGTAAPPKVVSPNIILITLDTTRADRMGFLGSTRGLTPNLDALARQSVVFTHAYSQAPLTPVSHATILTGTYPQFHQVIDFTFPLAKDLPYAPDILHGHGYRTAAFLGSVVLDPTGGAPGFERGFDIYDARFDYHYSRLGVATRAERRRGADVVAHAVEWLKQRPDGPFFLWVHLYDAHDPYEPPEPYKTKYASEPYDGGIAYEDFAVGTLLQQLKTSGLYDGAMIAVMADHGESLGAHGEETHGVFLYDETIQVPLLIKLPLAASAEKLSEEKRIDSRVELVDVMPTMLQAAGLEVPAEVQGESLLGRMKAGADQASDDSWRDRPAYAQADYPHLAYGWSALQSLRTGKYLYVQAPRRELYDEAGDQKAEHNLAPEMKAVADTVGDQLESFRKKTSSQREAPKMTEDPAAQEKLAALGYVMSTNAAKAAANGPGADPKDSENIETVKGLRKADLLIKGRHFADAVPVLQQVIARNPSISILYFKLGDSYVNLHQYDKAVPALRQAVELDPNNRKARWDLGASLVEVQDFAAAASAFEKILPKEPNARNPEIPILYAKLGHCYLKLHQYDKAVPTLRQAVELAPTSSGAMLDLGAALVEVQDFAAAAPELAEAVALLCMRPATAAAACQREIEQYNQTLENNPDAYAANLLLGSALLLSGDAAAAVPKLEKAAALQLKMPEPHTLLADAYLQLGQKAEADQERAEAARLGASGKE